MKKNTGIGIVAFLTAVIIAGWMLLDFGYFTQAVPIPKIVHYCWFGKQPESDFVQKAIASWKEFLPDFQIKRWDETNCDVNANPFVSEAYAQKRWDYVSDYCRVVALETEGGLYLDTDSFFRAPVKPLLVEPLVLTLQAQSTVSASFIGVVPHHPLMKKMRNWYEMQNTFIVRNIPSVLGSFFYEMYPQIKKENRLQQIKDTLILYPSNVLMLDFGGPENVAEHWYGHGKLFNQRGEWYYFFHQLFLQEDTYQIEEKKQDKTMMRNLIFLPQNRFYVYQTKEKGTYTFYSDKILVIDWDSGQKNGYTCQGRVCLLLVDESSQDLDKSNDFKEKKEFVIVDDTETFLGTRVFLKHDYWSSWAFIIKGKLVLLNNGGWAQVLSQDDEGFSVHWDGWGVETFKKQKDGSYLIFK